MILLQPFFTMAFHIIKKELVRIKLTAIEIAQQNEF